MTGFMFIARDALNHPELQNAERFGAWCKLLFSAAFNPVSVRIRGEDRVLENGQVYGTVRSFGEAFGWNDLSVNRYFVRLEKAGMITRAALGHGLLITILDRTTFCLERSDHNGPGTIFDMQPVGGSVARRPVFGRGRYSIPTAVRRTVRERDGDRCRYCGHTDGPFALDHVLPHSKGGPDTADNLVVACRPCNSAKGARTLQELGWSL